MSEEDVVRELSWRYYWPGADREDVAQEARFAIERCRPKWRPGGMSWRRYAWMCAESHLRELARRESLRRPQFAELVDSPAPDDLVERVEARRRLRVILEFPLGPRERRAIDRAVAGVVVRRCERTEQMARYRARRKLLTAFG